MSKSLKEMLNPKQIDFMLYDDNRINLLTGSVRSGKTYVSLLKWAVFVGSMPENNEFLMTGKTITSLKRNCLGLLQELVGDNFKYSISQKSGTLFGRRIWLEGANDDRAESKIRRNDIIWSLCRRVNTNTRGLLQNAIIKIKYERC